MESSGFTERRSSEDRRCRPTPALSRYTFFGGKREEARRVEDNPSVFVDRFKQGLFFAACLILMLNVLDAVFTILLLSYGGEEINPVARWLLAVGPWAFIVTKTIGIGLCTAVLVIIKNFKGAKLGILIVISLYLLLLYWHFYLCSTVIP